MKEWRMMGDFRVLPRAGMEKEAGGESLLMCRRGVGGFGLFEFQC